MSWSYWSGRSCGWLWLSCSLGSRVSNCCRCQAILRISSRKWFKWSEMREQAERWRWSMGSFGVVRFWQRRRWGWWVRWECRRRAALRWLSEQSRSRYVVLGWPLSLWRDRCRCMGDCIADHRWKLALGRSRLRLVRRILRQKRRRSCSGTGSSSSCWGCLGSRQCSECHCLGFSISGRLPCLACSMRRVSRTCQGI